jgi:anti-sigma factor RsiW
VTCSSVRPLIEAHLDDELDANQQAQIREHLEGCIACSAEFARLQQLQKDIRSQSLYFHAPDSLRQRIASSPRESTQARPLPWAWPWKWIAVAASIALILSLGTNLALSRAYRTENQLVAREVLSGHVRSMLGAHLVDVVSSDRHTVKPWFSGKLDFSPDVKDLASQGFPLSGGRVDYMDGRPVAALVFRRAQHVINLFTWPSGRSGSEEASQMGYHLVAWTKDGMRYWAVSDLNLRELKQFARLYQD